MKRKHTTWPRWARTVRNILLTLLLALLIWAAWDRPTVTSQAALRKKERQMLCPESTAAVEIKDQDCSHWVVQTDGIAMVFQVSQGNFFTNLSLRTRPLQEEPALYSFNWTATRLDEYGQPLTYIVYAAFRPPEGCATAVLSLHNDNGDFQAEGEPAGDFFLFYVRPNPENGEIVFRSSWFDSDAYTYELAFRDEAGALLKEVRG